MAPEVCRHIAKGLGSESKGFGRPAAIGLPGLGVKQAVQPSRRPKTQEHAIGGDMTGSTVLRKKLAIQAIAQAIAGVASVTAMTSGRRQAWCRSVVLLGLSPLGGVSGWVGGWGVGGSGMVLAML